MDIQELKSVTGTVFNVQHYSIHDGPGIRTTVFVKGCPLRCLWCSNPESQLPEPQLMYLEDKCTGCGACIEACKLGAVERQPDNPAKVRTDRDTCIACGACVEVCPTEARTISGETITAENAYLQVEEDRLFYGDDGGLTVSGGEALAHPRFTEALCTLCKDSGMNTAIETCGAVAWEQMKPVLEHVDLVLYDVKHMDSAKHKEYTGMGNELILDNLKRISDETDCTIIVRCPVIPPCNDSEEEMHALGTWLVENGIRVSEIDLLPYHNLGEGKRMQLEREKAFVSEVPDAAYVESLRDVLRGYGFLVK